MTDITITPINDVYMIIHCEKDIALTLNDFFSFMVPGASYIPSVRSKMWDGMFRLFDARSGRLYLGLLPYVTTIAKHHGWTMDTSALPVTRRDTLPSGVVKTLTGLNLPLKIREYQAEAIAAALLRKRLLILSPTASGKSLIIYSILRSIWEETQSPSLLIVPTTNLVEQMYSDFADYSKNNGWKVGANCHRIYAGHEKDTTKPITITTWQSIFRQPKSWFSKDKAVLGDECHLFQAKSMTQIMTRLVDCQFRIGLTGSLDDSQCHRLVLEGHFGAVYRSTTTKKLIEAGYLAQLDINSIIFKYKDAFKKEIRQGSYQDELKFLFSYKPRNEFISNLAINLKGNTLILFARVETHGSILHKLIKDKVNRNRKVFFIFGGTPTETREAIRKITEKETDAIIVASYGTFSTGINIKNLHNIIFAAPFKSKIRNLQSIGRGLRIGDKKVKAKLFDLADDLEYNGKFNYTMEHYLKRTQVYDSEGFSYHTKSVKI
jgi:superfamily II DNA or RNA helicase